MAHWRGDVGGRPEVKRASRHPNQPTSRSSFAHDRKLGPETKAMATRTGEGTTLVSCRSLVASGPRRDFALATRSLVRIFLPPRRPPPATEEHPAPFLLTMQKIVALACLVACVAVVSVSAQDACNGDDYGTAGQFDF